MLTLNRTPLTLALVSVVLLGLTATAQADEGAALATARTDQAAALSTDGRQESTTARQALATTAPATVSASAEGAAAGLPAASEQRARAEPSAAAGAASLAGQSPPSSPQARGTEISQAVNEAIAQVSAKQPQEAARVEPGSLAAASSATAQLIWQVEVSQCTSGCHGAKQYQSAEQQNTTRQQIMTAPAPSGVQGAPVTGERTQATSSVTQIQFGCLSYCFGTTTRQQPPLAPYGLLLADLLRQITTALSGLSPAPAAVQSAVEQVSLQSQDAAGGTLTQVQSAAQSSTTIQSYSSSLIAALVSAQGGPQAASGEALNQTEQGIWQLQIGCLFLCHETAQYQQAEQSNATLQTFVSAPGSAASSPASASDVVTQVIWQVQIGCLFWCFDATEQQIGATRNDLTVTSGEGAAAPPSPGASSISPSADNEPAQRPGTASSQTAADAQARPPAGRQGTIGAPAQPPSDPFAALPTLPTSTARVRERVAILPAASITTAGSDRPGASAARSATAHRPANWGARRADAPATFAAGGAYLRRPSGVPARAVARRLPLPFGAVGTGATFASPRRTAPGGLGVLLAVIALCTVGCLRIVAIRRRRGSHARHRGRLTSEQVNP